jgi:hypothetical protein
VLEVEPVFFDIRAGAAVVQRVDFAFDHLELDRDLLALESGKLWVIGVMSGAHWGLNGSIATSRWHKL